MTHSILFKTFLFSVALALSVNTAMAQKTEKKTKAPTEQRSAPLKTIDAGDKKPQEELFKYVYSVATIINADGKFIVTFEEGKARGEEKSREKIQTMTKLKEIGEKLQTEKFMPTSETDLLNQLAEQGLEIISVTNIPGREGNIMKYYFRTKVEY